jgi:hypothetical protein
MKEKHKRFNFKVPLKETEILNFLETQFKLHKGSKNEALRQTVKDNIAMKTAIIELKKENEELKAYKVYEKDFASGKEEELYQKATSFDFHKNFYDILLVQEEPNSRECICPPSKRHVHIPKDKKTGKYIVRDPRICGRCLALGCRKDTEKPKPVHNSKKKTQRDYCKRDDIHREYLDRTCLSCTLLPSECVVKKRMQKLAIPK